MNDMGNLEGLVVVFEGIERDTGKLVAQSVSVIFLGIEAFILNFPSQPACLTDLGRALGVEGEVGEMDKAGLGLFGLIDVLDFFFAFDPTEAMSLIIDFVDPAIVSGDALGFALDGMADLLGRTWG